MLRGCYDGYTYPHECRQALAYQTLLCSTMYLTVLVSFLYVILLCLADKTPFYTNSNYNTGAYGKYVTQDFVSNPEVTSVPVVNFMKPFSNSTTAHTSLSRHEAPWPNRHR